MANLKDKLQVLLDKELTSDEKRLLQLITFESSRKDCIVLRMPVGVIMLDALWHKIQDISKDKVQIAKADSFATIEELDEVLGNVEWLWKSWIPKGFITLLVGDPGIGKTMLGIDFARIISWGLKFPGETEAVRKPSNVVWIDAESGQQILRERCISMNVKRSNIYLPVFDGDILSQPDFLSEDHRQTLLNLIEAKKPELLVIDSLGGSNRRGENKIEEVRPLLEYLAALSRDYNFSTLLLHHLNKGSPGEETEVSLYRIRGSTAIPAFCRSIMAYEKGTKEDERKLRIIKSNLSRIPDPISATCMLNEQGDIMAINYGKYTAPLPKKTKKEHCMNWVLGVLRNKDGIGIHLKELCELGEDTGYARGIIYDAKDALGDRITVTGTGRDAIWILTSENDNDSISQITGAKNDTVSIAGIR
jgi:KaiC/GvpD/RAD55 family RecA-like ATPase